MQTQIENVDPDVNPDSHLYAKLDKGLKVTCFMLSENDLRVGLTLKN